MFQSGLSGEQPSAFGQLGPPARAFPGAAGVLRAAGRLGETGEQQGEQPQPERDDVDQQDGAQPTRAEQDGGEHRTEQLGPGQGGLGHRAGPAALFGPDHARDGGGERRPLEGRATGLHDDDRVHLPDGQVPGRLGGGHGHGREHGRRVRAEQHGAAPVAVHQDPGDRGGQHARSEAEQQTGGELGDGAGLLVDPQAEGEAGDAGSECGDQPADPDEHEGGHGRPTGGGARDRGMGRLRSEAAAGRGGTGRGDTGAGAGRGGASGARSGAPPP